MSNTNNGGRQKSKSAVPPIDADVLHGFFLHPYEEMTAREKREIDKVISVVLNRYFQSFYREFEDLHGSIMLAIFEKHKNYDITKDRAGAFQYIHRIALNAGTNITYRLARERVAELPAPDNRSVYNANDAPLELQSLLPYLMGLEAFTVLPLAPDQVLPVLLLLERGTQPRASEITHYESIINGLIKLLHYE